MSEPEILISWTPRKVGRGGYSRSRAAWLRWDDMAAVLDIAADIVPIALFITLTFCDGRTKTRITWAWQRQLDDRTALPTPEGICTYCNIPRSQCDPYTCREN